MVTINHIWYENSAIKWLLLPFALLFWLVSSCRRFLFAVGLKKATKVDAGVIVVGNISVGGNGKTPVVVALADYFTKKGYQVGLLSRGYGGKATDFPHLVLASDRATLVGDEPLLLARRTGLPVVIDPKRARGADALVNKFGCNLVICDDGLQHYALQRDIELVVMDKRLWGNGALMPMGPLREGKWRLNKVDAIIHNNAEIDSQALAFVRSPQWQMGLQPNGFRHVKHSERTATVGDMIAIANESGGAHAIAGIGYPQRFFEQLSGLNIPLKACKAFPDHHPYEAGDIPEGCTVMTEKDAVKLGKLAHDNCWYQPIDAQLPEAFYNQLSDLLIAAGYQPKGKHHGL